MTTRSQSLEPFEQFTLRLELSTESVQETVPTPTLKVKAVDVSLEPIGACTWAWLGAPFTGVGAHLAPRSNSVELA